jgi:hypothetical protein
MMSGTDCRPRHRECGFRVTPVFVTAITGPRRRLTIENPHTGLGKNTRPSREAGDVTGSIAYLPAVGPARREAGPFAGFTSVDHKRYSMA